MGQAGSGQARTESESFQSIQLKIRGFGPGADVIFSVPPHTKLFWRPWSLQYQYTLTSKGSLQ